MDQRFWKFVNEHRGDNPAMLRLKYHGASIDGVDIAMAITQIECRQKFGKKLRQTLEADPDFLFPSVLAGEQSTSDLLAGYHSSLIGNPQAIIDMTSGLGIDALHAALTHPKARVMAIDIDPAKTEALEYNASRLGLDNLQAINGDSTTMTFESLAPSQSVTFIDPARRASDGSRVYSLSDCQPDIVGMIPRLCSQFGKIIVKASPMLDISHSMSLLPSLARVITLGTVSECKELLFISEPTEAETVISAVTLSPSGKDTEFSFTRAEESAAQAEYVHGLDNWQYLYEPFPATMKAGPFNLLSQRYGLLKLHPNTHLYVGNARVDDFPGHAWEIERIIPFESKHLKRLKREYPNLNIAVRNFDMPAEKLRSKLGISDGGNRRLIAATLSPSVKAMFILK